MWDNTEEEHLGFPDSLVVLEWAMVACVVALCLWAAYIYARG